MSSPRIELVCPACGFRAASDDALPPFGCPRTGLDDGDHVLARRWTAPPAPDERWRERFLAPAPQPFVRYRRLLGSWGRARRAGLSDDAFLRIVHRLGAAVEEVDGRGLLETPLSQHPGLAARLGVSRLFAKDETGQVAGSHKARHLFGILVSLEVDRRLAPPMGAEPPLAIASCGNAALAAAVLARAAERPLSVFVPPEAHPSVLGRIAALGATIVPCPRTGVGGGDPCIHRFTEAVETGHLPFTCQTATNALGAEGGATLGWEIVSASLRSQLRFDRLFVQVGGGALATACILALREARDLGLLEALPRVHAVQTEGAAPLHRAWRRVAERVVGRSDLDDASLARAVAVLPPPARQDALSWAARHREACMWPWETTPHSAASGILDDETYDWHAVVAGMLATGGWPVVVPEERVVEAHRLVRRHTSVPADPTGTAGLAGALELASRGALDPAESVAVLFTGLERG